MAENVPLGSAFCVDGNTTKKRGNEKKHFVLEIRDHFETQIF